MEMTAIITTTVGEMLQEQMGSLTGAHGGTEKTRCESGGTRGTSIVEVQEIMTQWTCFQKPFLPAFKRVIRKLFLKCPKLIQNQSLHSVLHWLLNPPPHCFPVKGWTGSRIRYPVHSRSDTASPTGGVCNDPGDSG